MSAGGPADSVYKSSEASPLRDLQAPINQAPGEETDASAHFRRTLSPQGGNDHKVIAPPRDRAML